MSAGKLLIKLYTHTVIAAVASIIHSQIDVTYWQYA
jgi:hypothetical protein